MSTQTVILYHNPRCSKSRKALQIIRAKGIEPEIIEYLRNPPDISTLKRLITMLGIDAEKLVRKNEPTFKVMHLLESEIDTEQWLELLQQNPVLLQRPIIIANNNAIIGRPPERVSEFLDNIDDD